MPVRKRIVILFILSSIFTSLITAKTVKVGYFIDSGNFMSGFGPEDERAGYAYEYLQTIAAYTGWNYEYFYAEWDQLYAALLSGKIDILPDVSYTPERKNLIHYPDFSMGKEAYYIYTNDADTTISAGDFSTWAGKTMGLRTDCNYYDIYMEWQKDKNLNVKYVEFDSSFPYENMFDNHEFDMLLDIDMVADTEWNPIEKIGESEIYLAVTKNRTDILEELNTALAEIHIMNPYFDEKLWLKYFSEATISKSLTSKETEWLSKNNTIYIGCLTDDIPYSDINDDSNEPEGIIINLMNYLKKNMLPPENEVSFKMYDTFDEMNSDFLNGKLNIIAPVYRDLNYAENSGTLLSEKFSSVILGLVYKDSINLDAIKTLAIPQNLRVPPYTALHYPDAKVLTYKTLEECFEAVKNGKADGMIANIYKIRSNLNRIKAYSNLKYVELPAYCDLAFLVQKSDTPLISLINKLLMRIPAETISTYTEYFAVKDQGYTRSNFVKDYLSYLVIYLIIFSILLISLIYALQRIREYIEFDPLTKLLNRRNMEKKINKTLRRAEEKDEPFAIMILDLDDFKILNDTYGHAFGDKVLQAVAKAIVINITDQDFAFRWGGEEFLIIYKGDREAALSTAERIRVSVENQRFICTAVEPVVKDINVTVTIGLSVFEKGETYRSMFQTSDENLYKGKRDGKNKVVI